MSDIDVLGFSLFILIEWKSLKRQISFFYSYDLFTVKKNRTRKVKHTAGTPLSLSLSCNRLDFYTSSLEALLQCPSMLADRLISTGVLSKFNFYRFCGHI